MKGNNKMTDNLESNSQAGSAGSPNPDVSSAGNVQPTSTFDASKLPEQLESIVAKAVEKAVQSTKDRRFSNIEKQLDDFKPVMERVKEILTPEQLAQMNQIQRDAEFEELKRTVYGQPQTGTPKTGTPQGTATIGTTDILNTLGLDGNDPEVIEKVLKSGDPAQAALNAAKIAVQRANQTPPSLSASASIDGTPPKPADASALKSEYIKEISANRGKRDAIKAIQEKYRKMGFDPGSVGFSV